MVPAKFAMASPTCEQTVGPARPLESANRSAAEKEITKVLQMQRRLCDHLGLADVKDDAEAMELSENTAVDRLAEELRRRLPEE